MSIVFNDTLRTGNDLIDSQHQELIARVNKLTEDCRVGTEKLVAVQTLGFLMDYTNVHLQMRKSFRQTTSIRCWKHIRCSMLPS